MIFEGLLDSGAVLLLVACAGSSLEAFLLLPASQALISVSVTMSNRRPDAAIPLSAVGGRAGRGNTRAGADSIVCLGVSAGSAVAVS